MVQSDKREVVMFDTENSIILGDYLDLLLNRTQDFRDADGKRPAEGVYIECSHDNSIRSTISKLGQYEYISYANNSWMLHNEKKEKPLFTYSGGIRTPHYHGVEKIDEGSGNIVISGRPGVGKSTLAFQFAAACASSLNKGIAVYFSLDIDEKQIVKSMKNPNGSLNINFLCDYSSAKGVEMLQYDANSDEALEMMFREALYKKEQKIVPQIVFPKLSPRGISSDAGAKEDAIFLERIDELQKMLRAIHAYNTKEREKKNQDRNPLVKLVVIDSLDVFGEKTLTREEINRLFMLFKQYGIIGVFTMGSVDYDSLAPEAAYKAAVTYQADVLIEMKKEFYNNYTCSYFEVLKSRYIRHVLGHHPYKVENYEMPLGNGKSEEDEKEEFSFKNNDLIKKIVVLPSLHYRISASENSVLPFFVDENKKGEEKNTGKDEKKYEKTIFGIAEMIEIMPNHFRERSMNLPQIITISGNSGLFKSDIALNALFSGIVDKEENGLIVRLGDRDAFAVRGVRFESNLLRRTKKWIKKKDKQEDVDDKDVYFYERDVHNDEPNKYTLKGWSIRKNEEMPHLLEVTFKNGALLPEEFVDEICKIINIYKIRRVVFVDLKYIGSSYPFLVNSDTSGNLFLSAFVHIMRNYGMHVIMSSSESGLEDSDVELKKAGILADAILSCKAETDQGRYESVYIMGEGLITDEEKRAAKFKTDYKNDYNLKFYNESEIENNGVRGTVKLRPFSIILEKE